MSNYDLREDNPAEIDSGALAQRILKWTTEDTKLITPVPGLALVRRAAPTDPASYLHEPGICLVAQGAKRVTLGDDAYEYDAQHFLITSVGLPVVAQVTDASEDRPYLGLLLEFDQRVLAQLMLDSDLPLARAKQSDRGMAVGRMTGSLVGAFERLLDLLDEPEDIPIMASLIQKEILYRLLVGEQGERLRQIASAGSHSNQIAKAIGWLQENYTQPLKVEDLASRAGMSASTFHHHFRSLTAMSPLQYQKWMRLNEARQLMLVQRMDAASAAFQVGYESPSQFSREYSRQFGAPPMRDIRQLEQSGGGMRSAQA